MPSNLQILPTPSQEEFMFSIRVPDTKFRPDLFLSTGKALTSAITADTNGTNPTTYAEFAWAVNHEKIQTQSAFFSYVYLKCEKADADHLAFFFGKPKTRTEMNTPFQQFWDTRQYTWPAVLEDLWAVDATTFPQTVNNGTGVDSTQRIIPRYRYRPAVPYNSTVLVQQFLSPVPWKQSDLEHPQPVPTDVNGTYIGVRMDFPRCLHPTCTFPELVPGARIIQGVGVANPPPGRNTQRMIFPKTNFTDHAPFFIEDRQQPANGLFLRELVEIYPPPPPKRVIA